MRRGVGRRSPLERGPHPAESNRVAFVFLRRDGSRARARTPASRLALAPETARNHWVARKAAACQYLIPLLLSFFVSPFFFSSSVLFPLVIFSFLLDTIYELSRQPFLVLFIFYHYHIRFFSILLSLPHSIRSLIKYICLTRTHTREHAHLIIVQTDRIIPGGAAAILTTWYDCFRDSFTFYEPINCYPRASESSENLPLFVLWNTICFGTRTFYTYYLQNDSFGIGIYDTRLW